MKQEDASPENLVGETGGPHDEEDRQKPLPRGSCGAARARSRSGSEVAGHEKAADRGDEVEQGSDDKSSIQTQLPDREKPRERGAEHGACCIDAIEETAGGSDLLPRMRGGAKNQRQRAPHQNRRWEQEKSHQESAAAGEQPRHIAPPAVDEDVSAIDPGQEPG